MKTCSKCNIAKPIEAFTRKPNGDPKSWCKECKREYDRLAYKTNTGQGVNRKERLKAHAAKAKEQAQEYIWNYLATHPCVDCGETDIVVLEFDHLYDKEHNIARLCQGAALSRIEAEIAKCEVRCANCHKRATARRGGWKKLSFAGGQTGKVATL